MRFSAHFTHVGHALKKLLFGLVGLACNSGYSTGPGDQEEEDTDTGKSCSFLVHAFTCSFE